MTRTVSRSVRRQGSVIEIQGTRGVSYKLKFELPADAKGERRTGYKTLRGVSRKEAEAELAKLLEKVGKGPISLSQVFVVGFLQRNLITSLVHIWLVSSSKPMEVSYETPQKTMLRAIG